MKHFNHNTVKNQTPIKGGAEKVLEFNKWIEYNYQRLIDSGYMVDALNDVYISVYNRLLYSTFEILNSQYDKYICSAYFMQLKENAYMHGRYTKLEFDVVVLEQNDNINTSIDKLDNKVKKVITSLNAPTKHIFSMVYFEKYNYKEVAEKLAIPYDRVLKTYHRINKRVITEIKASI